MTRRILAFLLLFFPLLGNASVDRTQGVYVGLGLDVIAHKEPLWTPVTMAILDITHFRPYFGYRFSNSFALEGSYDGFRENSGNYDRYNFDLFDIAGKFYYPLSNRVDVYLRPGVVYAREEVANDRNFWGLTPYHETHHRIAPTIGTGLMVYVNHHWSTDLYYIYIPPMGREISSANIFGLGVTYNFDRSGNETTQRN